MKKVYFISGLGADRTVFDRLDLSFCEPVFLDWIKPVENESLRSYALRLGEKIAEKDATIVGLSMGGMMASEIVKANPGMKAIIISSIRSAKQFPAYTRFAIKRIGLYRFTKGIMKLIFPISSWFIGAKTKEDRQHLWNMIAKRDIPFIKWCIGAIGSWELKEEQPNIIHIHGTADKLLPYKYVKPDHSIPRGEHFMIKTRAKELSELLKRLCT